MHFYGSSVDLPSWLSWQEKWNLFCKCLFVLLPILPQHIVSLTSLCMSLETEHNYQKLSWQLLVKKKNQHFIGLLGPCSFCPDSLSPEFWIKYLSSLRVKLIVTYLRKLGIYSIYIKSLWHKPSLNCFTLILSTIKWIKCLVIIVIIGLTFSILHWEMKQIYNLWNYYRISHVYWINEWMSKWKECLEWDDLLSVGTTLHFIWIWFLQAPYSIINFVSSTYFLT